MKSTIITSLLALAFTAGLNAQSVLRVRGSDTLGAKLVPQWAEQFKKQGGGVSFDIAAEGSSTAFTNLAAGTAEIGMSSRKVKDDERTFAKTKGVFLTEHEVAWDMIAVVVNKNNPVTNLTKKQIAGIFTGAIKDWSEVGGTPGPISVYTRNTSSGTYKDWQSLAMKGKDYAPAARRWLATSRSCPKRLATPVASVTWASPTLMAKASKRSPLMAPPPPLRT
ncbi:substrate-binding domain-containing protein [Verrucomicrobium spinosum]|uniref:substrate-binding domain-containing protein n=1 Tax=Verrucomicrobium spinosum TaxID=2736 RepID=UPI000A7E1509|nr:substrate-binding domain-containing protein [Verrucomicrobium spinosum]